MAGTTTTSRVETQDQIFLFVWGIEGEKGNFRHQQSKKNQIVLETL